MSIKDIRRQNLLLLRASVGGSNAELGRFTGIEPKYLEQIINRREASSNTKPRNMGHSIARRLEVAFGLPEFAMDHPLEAMPPSPLRQPMRPSHLTVSSLAAAPIPIAEARASYNAGPASGWPFRGITAHDWHQLDEGDRMAIEIYARALCDKRIARGA